MYHRGGATEETVYITDTDGLTRLKFIDGNGDLISVPSHEGQYGMLCGFAHLQDGGDEAVKEVRKHLGRKSDEFKNTMNTALDKGVAKSRAEGGLGLEDAGFNFGKRSSSKVRVSCQFSCS